MEIVEVQDAERLARRIPERAHVVVLDQGGHSRDSTGLSRWLQERRHAGRDLAFVIGGPFGIDVEARDDTLTLGPLTLPFQLARVVLLEQLYRAHKILAGEPYHH